MGFGNGSILYSEQALYHTYVDPITLYTDLDINSTYMLQFKIRVDSVSSEFFPVILNETDNRYILFRLYPNIYYWDGSGHNVCTYSLPLKQTLEISIVHPEPYRIKLYINDSLIASWYNTQTIPKVNSITFGADFGSTEKHKRERQWTGIIDDIFFCNELLFSENTYDAKINEYLMQDILMPPKVLESQNSFYGGVR